MVSYRVFVFTCVLAGWVHLLNGGLALAASPPDAKSSVAAQADAKARAIVGRVVDPEGQGIPDADVGLMVIEDVNNESEQSQPFVAVAKTDAHGLFRIPWRDEFKKTWGTLWAHAKGFGPAHTKHGIDRGVSP